MINGNNKNSSVECFHQIQESGVKDQLKFLGKMDIFPIEISESSPLVHCKSFTTGEELFLMKNIGVIYFGDSPLFDEAYPIQSSNGKNAGFGLKRGVKFEMHLIDEEFISHPVTNQILNGLVIGGDFKSYRDLVEFIQFYYSGVLNSLNI